MRYGFADAALEEYIAAGQYYNRKVPGLGDAFVDEVEAGVASILASPRACRVVEDDVRRYLVKRFPYGIYYSIEPNEIVVIWAVKHLRRNPDYWQERRRSGG
ncbi:MAG TPA: type II toxin-antitoxin system RelE/ParE family toxin [Opitutaceae bacterium]|nr:type II toxin-antitoxin system RelE/ParE family toxin [Opitutaceae bacterium]